MFSLSEFGYDFPTDLIAQHPLARREQARLMIINRETDEIKHDNFSNIGAYLPERSLLVLNDTRVIPARIYGHKERTGGRVEVFLLRQLTDSHCFETLLRPAGRIREGEKIIFPGSRMTATVIDKPRRIVRFSAKNISLFLRRCGHVPLPPYIRREDTREDRQDYQTVYARHPGSVAAPTAGLHFTKALLAKLKKQGHGAVPVTLHVNFATFKPVVDPDIRDHRMHTESYSVAPKAWRQIVSEREKGRKIVAVGTTSCRVLEALAKNERYAGETDIFIYPGYSFRMTDCLITNFHMPFSTLLMLVYAFGGTALMRRAYQEAIEKQYRFFSYGDGMLIL